MQRKQLQPEIRFARGIGCRSFLQQCVFCCWKNYERNVIIHIDDVCSIFDPADLYVCMCINLLGQKSNEYIDGDRRLAVNRVEGDSICKNVSRSRNKICS